jgi:signal transduction histidine kinase/CheY-like chemotaxis protein
MIKRLVVFDEDGESIIPFLKSSIFVNIQTFESMFRSSESEVLSIIQNIIHAEQTNIITMPYQNDTETCYIINSNTDLFYNKYENFKHITFTENCMIIPLNNIHFLIILNKILKFIPYDVQKTLPYIVYIKHIIEKKNQMQIDDLKNLFLASISHELRTPLNGIIGITQLLNIDDPKQTEYIHILKTCTTQLIELINDILDYSKLKAHQMTLSPHAFNIKNAIYNSIDILKHSADQKNIKLNVKILNPLPHSVIGDERRIKQIFINLISNAIKFTENGKIDIIVDIDPNHNNTHDTVYHNFICQINDTGCGIPHSEQSFIFDCFSKSYQSNTTSLNPGAGLGLSIVKQLIELMEGTITVFSDGKVGTSFCFNMLLEDDTDIDSIIQNYDSLFVNKVICIIDDNSHDKIQIMNMLHAWNCCIHLFSSVHEFEYFNNHVDAIFLNIHLYNRTMKSLFCNYPVIGLCHTITDTHPSFCVSCIQKPVSRSKLFNILVNIFLKRNNKKQVVRRLSDTQLETTSVNIIIAEDDFYNQLLLKEMLINYGIPTKHITITSNGQECVDKLKENHYDICFMDIKMPVLDGIQATEIIKKMTSPPIIITVSASVLEKDYKLCFDAGTDYFIEKPIIKDKLFSLLKNLIV